MRFFLLLCSLLAIQPEPCVNNHFAITGIVFPYYLVSNISDYSKSVRPALAFAPLDYRATCSSINSKWNLFDKLKFIFFHDLFPFLPASYSGLCGLFVKSLSFFQALLHYRLIDKPFLIALLSYRHLYYLDIH